MYQNAFDYNAWYQTPRGAWTGDAEYARLSAMLQAQPGDRILDVGCGTGYFTRRLAADGYSVVGADKDPGMLKVANALAGGASHYCLATADALPFNDDEFDCSVAIASFCFIKQQTRALGEMRRVTKRRIVLGLLNRFSLHHWQKGRHGGSGAYRDAHWHNLSDAYVLFAAAGLKVEQHASSVFIPEGGWLSRAAERVIPPSWPFGAMLFVSADVK